MVLTRRVTDLEVHVRTRYNTFVQERSGALTLKSSHMIFINDLFPRAIRNNFVYV